MNTFNEYQQFTNSLAVYNEDVALWGDAADVGVEMKFLYPVLALSEEAGEVAGKVAKFVRKSKGMSTPDLRQALDDLCPAVLKELGDVAYSLSEVAKQFGYTFQDVIDANVSKLTDRADRGVLVGEGDNR